MGMGPAQSLSPPLLVLTWLLYILSYRISVQLDFRRFLIMVILWLSWNSDVVVGGCECYVYLSTILTQNCPSLMHSYLRFLKCDRTSLYLEFRDY